MGLGDDTAGQRRPLVFPSASGLDLAMACPASVVLPGDHTGPSEATERGTICHKYLEDVASGIPLEHALSQVPDQYRAWIGAIDVRRIMSGLTDVSVEVPYALDPYAPSVRRLAGTQRDYSDRRPGEFVGTVDVIAKRDGRWLVRDYKTGSNLGDPAVKWQLKFAAAALHLETGADQIVVEFLYIYQDGSHAVESAVFDEWDHMGTIDALARLGERIKSADNQVSNGNRPDVYTGDHCRFCPSFFSCPSKVGALLHASAIVAPSSKADLAEAWRRYEAARQAVDRVKPIISQIVDRQEIVLDDYTSVRMIDSGKRELSTAKLQSLARKLGATDEQILSCVAPNSYSYPRVVKRKGK